MPSSTSVFCLQLMSFLIFSVQFRRCPIIFSWSSHIRSLPWVIFMHVDRVTSPNKIESNLVDVFTFIEPHLDPSFTSANAFHVILLNLCRDYMLHIGNFLQRSIVKALWQSFDVHVNNLLLSEVLLCMVLCSIVTGQ